MKNELLSVQAAAAELGVSPRSVQLWVQQGKLPAETLQGTNVLIIRLKDLDKVRVRNPAGRPKKGKKP